MNNNEFYKNLSYSNDIEYVEKNIKLNISASEITKIYPRLCLRCRRCDLHI